MESTIVFLGVLVVASALSFLFSGMEAGVFALSRLRIRGLKRAGLRSAQLLHHYLENAEEFLWTILIGNTLANFTAYTLVILALHHNLQNRPGLLVASFILFAFLFYAICDLLPKMLFRRFPNRLCLMLALPFRFVHLALSPLVALVRWFSHGLLRVTGLKGFAGQIFGNRREFRQVMQESSQNLSSEELAMINRVLDLQNVSVRSVAIPLNRAVAVTADSPCSQLLDLARERPINRVPVWTAETDGARRIVGIASVADMLYDTDYHPDKPVNSYVKPALYLREDIRLEEALRRLQRSGKRLAIVLGTDQREIGIVSLHDILRVIFGEVTL